MWFGTQIEKIPAYPGGLFSFLFFAGWQPSHLILTATRSTSRETDSDGRKGSGLVSEGAQKQLLGIELHNVTYDVARINTKKREQHCD